MQETHTIATMEIDKGQLLEMAFGAKRLRATEFRRDPRTKAPIVDAQGKPQLLPMGAINRIAKFIRTEESRAFDRDSLVIGDESSPWFFSYYNDGMLYRLMKDGRVRLESADADDMNDKLYDEFCALIDDIMMMELTLRLNQVVKVVSKHDAENNGMGFKVKDKAPKKLANAKYMMEIV